MDKTSIKIVIPALEKLLDYVASGVGSVAGPMLAPWMAGRSAKAKLIETRATADSLVLIANAQAEAQATLSSAKGPNTGRIEINEGSVRQWVEFQNEKRLRNIRSVIHRAADSLDDSEAPDVEPDPDWTARFFEAVQDVSTEEMQEFWARLLSGEILNPRSVSIQTLGILRNMSKHDAETFSAFTSCEINGIVPEECYRALATRLPDKDLIGLAELGLLHGPLAVFRVWNVNKKGYLAQSNCGHILFIEGPPNSKFEVHGWTLTRPAHTLADICRPNQPNMDYMRLFARFLAARDCALRIAPRHLHPKKGDYLRLEEAKLVKPV